MKLPQVLADPASSGRSAASRDFGGGEGMAAMGQAVSGVGDIAGKLFEEEMSAQVSGSLADATRSLNDLGMEVQANPDHNTRNKLYAEGAQKIASDFRKGLKYPRFQGMFDERLEGTLESGRLGVKHGVEKAQIDSAKANRLSNIERIADDLENVSDPEKRNALIGEAIEEFDAGVRGGLWNAAQAATMQIKLEDRIAAHELITESQATADELRDLHPADQIAAVQALPPGKLRAQVDALVHHQIEVDAALKRELHEKSTDALFLKIEAGLLEDGTPMTTADVLKEGQAAGLGMYELGPLLSRLPTVAEPTAESRKAEFTADSNEYRLKLEEMASHPDTQASFFGIDLYDKKPVFNTSSETGDQAVDFNGQPMFYPSVAELLSTPDMKIIKALKKAGPAAASRKADILKARDGYFMAMDKTQWVEKKDRLWDLHGNQGAKTERAMRTRAIQQWDDAVDHAMATAPGGARDWLYPKELREITVKLLTPQVLDTGASGWGGGFFSGKVLKLARELTKQGMDDEIGSIDAIQGKYLGLNEDTGLHEYGVGYTLEMAEAGVAQMADEDVADIRARDRSAADKDPIGDRNDLEALRDILVWHRHDLNQIMQGIFP